MDLPLLCRAKGRFPIPELESPGFHEPQKCESTARLRCIVFQDGVQSLDEQTCIGFRENQRRAQLDDVVMRAVGAREDAAIAQAVDDVGRLQRGRLARFKVEHKIGSQEQS